jgi:hypothetical protein
LKAERIQIFGSEWTNVIFINWLGDVGLRLLDIQYRVPGDAVDPYENVRAGRDTGQSIVPPNSSGISSISSFHSGHCFFIQMIEPVLCQSLSFVILNDTPLRPVQQLCAEEVAKPPF